MRHNPSVLFHLKLYMLWRKWAHQSQNLKLTTARIKIYQIPYFIFQTTSQFFFKYCITLHCHDTQLLCNFLAQTLYTLNKKVSQSASFENFECSSAPKHKSLFVQSLHISSKFALIFSISRITALSFFSSNIIYFGH